MFTFKIKANIFIGIKASPKKVGQLKKFKCTFFKNWYVCAVELKKKKDQIPR